MMKVVILPHHPAPRCQVSKVAFAATTRPCTGSEQQLHNGTHHLAEVLPSLYVHAAVAASDLHHAVSRPQVAPPQLRLQGAALQAPQAPLVVCGATQQGLSPIDWPTAAVVRGMQASRRHRRV